MKTIIAGSRTIKDPKIVAKAIQDSGLTITEVVSGGALGVDILGERWARSHGLPVRQFLADWERYGRSAGIIRNHQMGDYADALVAVWDGKSPGTKDMIAYAQKKGLRAFVKTIDSDCQQWAPRQSP